MSDLRNFEVVWSGRNDGGDGDLLRSTWKHAEGPLTPAQLDARKVVEVEDLCVDRRNVTRELVDLLVDGTPRPLKYFVDMLGRTNNSIARATVNYHLTVLLNAGVVCRRMQVTKVRRRTIPAAQWVYWRR